jgi:glycosyltransferase involved in cell wall biosynthesis
MVLRGYELLFTSHLEEGYCEWADIIAIQRQVDSKVRAMMNKYRALGKKIIYEIDDFFHSLPVSNPVMPSFRQRPDWLRNMECLIYQSDALIVSTPELAKQYGRFNQNTNIVPNHLDLGAFPIDRIEPNSSSANVRIGWAGSTTHDADMPHMIEAMDMILKEFPQTTMVFMGADYRHLFEDIPLNRMEWIPNTYHHEMPVEEYYENLVDAQLDIGLAPLEDNLFNRCKSDIKIFEYMALGIVPVASDVEPYSNILKQTNAEGTKYGFLAKNTKQWYRRIKTLIEDPGTRYAMGMAGLDKTWTERNLNRMADRYEEIIQKVMDGNGHPKRTEQRMTNGVIETVPKEPMHSLNVPYLGNMTAKQANNNYQHSLAEQKRLAALQTEFVQAQESTG